MTRCNESRSEFGDEGRREVVGEFNGGTISSGGGALPLQATDRQMKLLRREARAFWTDATRSSCSTDWSRCWQRVYALALGYEDLDDHEQLRHHPPVRVVCWQGKTGRGRAGGQEHPEPHGTGRRDTGPLQEHHLLTGRHR